MLENLQLMIALMSKPMEVFMQISMIPSVFALTKKGQKSIWIGNTRDHTTNLTNFLVIGSLEKKGAFNCTLSNATLLKKKKRIFSFTTSLTTERNKYEINVTTGVKFTVEIPSEIPPIDPIFEARSSADRFFLSSLALGAFFIITYFTPPSIFGRLLPIKSKSLLVLFAGSLASFLHYRHLERKTLEMTTSFCNLFFNINSKACECRNGEAIQITSLLNPGQFELCDSLL